MKFLTKKIAITIIIISALSLVLSACQSNGEDIDIDAQKTSFAITAEAQSALTATALQAAQPTATNTPEVSEPTPTPTATLSETSTTETPGETTTPGGPTATATSTDVPSQQNGTDFGQWVSNDPPDNTKIEPGKDFTVTWSLINQGTTTWTTSYYIRFTTGAQMGAPEKVYMPYPVPPGKIVDISVDFTAPEDEGTKTSNWELVNAQDQAFQEPFYVVIEVSN